MYRIVTPLSFRLLERAFRTLVLGFSLKIKPYTETNITVKAWSDYQCAYMRKQQKEPTKYHRTNKPQLGTIWYTIIAANERHLRRLSNDF